MEVATPIQAKNLAPFSFAIGFIASIAAIVRTVYTYKAVVVDDRTWAAYPVYIWSWVELYLGLVTQISARITNISKSFFLTTTAVCACVLPSLGSWDLYYPKLVGSLNRSEQNSSMSSSRFWCSKSRSNPNRRNVIELADTDDEERGVFPERDVTIETFHHPKAKRESMGSQGSCAATYSTTGLPCSSFKPWS